MKLEETIKILNYKYKFAQLNMHWNYYLREENKDETELLTNISNRLMQNIISDNSIKLNSVSNYEINDMDFDKMKEIVKTFFININPELSEKVEYALSRTIGIEKTEEKSRSVTDSDKILFYYETNQVKSLVELAHEVSHAISNLSVDENKNVFKDNKNKVGQFAEIESGLTEDIFLEYLANMNDLNMISKTDGTSLCMENLKEIKYNKLKNTMNHVYRVLDELMFQSFMKQNGYKNITIEVLEDFCKKNNIKDKTQALSNIDRTLNHYCHDMNMNYVPENKYDLKNGEHLSNECRFIYAYCITEKFNNMNLSFEEKKKFYFNYLNNNKNMSFKDIISIFNIDLSKPLSESLTEDFIVNYNNVVVENQRMQRHV